MVKSHLIPSLFVSVSRCCAPPAHRPSATPPCSLLYGVVQRRGRVHKGLQLGDAGPNWPARGSALRGNEVKSAIAKPANCTPRHVPLVEHHCPWSPDTCLAERGKFGLAQEATSHVRTWLMITAYARDCCAAACSNACTGNRYIKPKPHLLPRGRTNTRHGGLMLRWEVALVVPSERRVLSELKGASRFRGVDVVPMGREESWWLRWTEPQQCGAPTA